MEKVSLQKTKKTIYLGGKVTGEPIAEVEKKFDKAEIYWRGMGYEVVNPVKIIINVNANRKRDGLEIMTEWLEIMKYLLPFIAMADEAYFMRDWKWSEGAKIEQELMSRLGYIIHYEVDPFEG